MYGCVFDRLLVISGADDPLMPDSLTDGDGDWKAGLDDAGRGAYKELGLAL